jgi:hypothetical protein
MLVACHVSSLAFLQRKSSTQTMLSLATSTEATEDGCTFQPNPNSNINPDHLSYFWFVGRIIGKAVADGFLLGAHFTCSLYKAAHAWSTSKHIWLRYLSCFMVDVTGDHFHSLHICRHLIHYSQLLTICKPLTLIIIRISNWFWSTIWKILGLS